MNANRIETSFTEDGKLSLQNLPFKKRCDPGEVSSPKERAPRGDEVEIIIVERNLSKTASVAHPLRGTVISYDDPFEPATSFEDWEVLQ